MDRATAAVGGAFKKQLQPILTAVILILLLIPSMFLSALHDRFTGSNESDWIG